MQILNVISNDYGICCVDKGYLHSVSYVYVHVFTFGLLMECQLNGFGPFYSTEKYTATALKKYYADVKTSNTKKHSKEL